MDDSREPARLRDGAEQHAAFVRLLKDNVLTPEQLSDQAHGMIRAALAGAEIDPSAPWMYVTLTFSEQAGERYASGRCFVSAEPLGFAPGSVSSADVAAFPYPWTDQQRPYQLDVLGLEVTSDEEAQACPDGVLWTMQFGSEVATQLAAFQCRAYRPGDTVYAQTDWRPGWPKVAETFGGDLASNTKTAAVGRALLLDIPASTRGRRAGDGSIWSGGVPEFLDDLWTTLEYFRASTGKPWGVDIMSRQFRHKMRGSPSTSTLYTWLKDAQITRKEVEGCRVDRLNYSEFVGRKAP